MDRGPRTGVTGAVYHSDLDFVEGGGAQGAGGGPWIADLGWWIDRVRDEAFCLENSSRREQLFVSLLNLFGTVRISNPAGYCRLCSRRLE